MSEEEESISTSSSFSSISDGNGGEGDQENHEYDMDPNDLIPKSLKLSPTEERNPKSMNLSSMDLIDSIQLFIDEESAAVKQLLNHKQDISLLIEDISNCLSHGGRLFYVGAGTSGRLGVMDASECYSTFSTPIDTVQGIIAGGNIAVYEPYDCAEETFYGGIQAVKERGLTDRDAVIGISASGTTPFLWGGLWFAIEKIKCYTGLITFNPHLEFKKNATPKRVIAINVGPEVLTGSTRLKCGTTTKVLLNMISTLTLGVKMSRIQGNLMVNLHPSNSKLKQRALRILMSLMQKEKNGNDKSKDGIEETQVETILTKNGYHVKDALLYLNRFE